MELRHSYLFHAQHILLHTVAAAGDDDVLDDVGILDDVLDLVSRKSPDDCTG